MSRVFFGLQFSDTFNNSIQDSLGKVQKDIKKKNMEFQWVKTPNYHLTTNFIGEVTEEQLERLKEIARELSGRLPRFKLEPKELSCFPSEMAARVLFLKFKSNKGLVNLQNELEEALVAASIYCDQKEFVPHLTLARTRKQRNMKDTLSLMPKLKQTLLIDRFSLLKSPEGSDSPFYQVVESFDLLREAPNPDS